MTKLHIDGTDLYGSTVSDDLEVLWRWTAIGSAGAWNTYSTGGPFGGGYISKPSNSAESAYLSRAIASSSKVGFAGWWRPPSVGNGAALGQFYIGGTAQITLTGKTGGLIDVKRGTEFGTIIATSTVAYSLNTWQHIEYLVKFHNTQGEVGIKINGNWVLAYTTGLDTINSATGVDEFRLQCQANGDDWAQVVIYNDSTAGVPNNWIGPHKIPLLYVSADSTQLDFTASSGASHFALLDDVPMDGNTYVYSTSTGTAEVLLVEDLVGSYAAYYGMNAVAIARKDSIGGMQLRVGLESSSTYALGTATNFSTSYAGVEYWTTATPGSTTGLTVGEINNVKWRAEVV